MRIGIIGCGVIGRTHHASLSANPACDDIVCCDIAAQRARDLAGNASWCDDPAILLADPTVTGVTIGTPHPVHAGLVHTALAAGKHVLCEKPLGVHPSALTALVAAEAEAAEQGLITAGVFQHRFSPAAAALREALTTGTFGNLVAARVDFACKRDATYYDADAWRGTWRDEGGGVLINQGIHTLDIALWLLADAAGGPRLVTGRAENRWTADFAEVEDHVAGVVRLTSGLDLDVLAVNTPDGGWRPQVEIRGTRGRCTYSTNADGCFVELVHEDPAVVRRLMAVDGRHRETATTTGKACYGGLHADQIGDWLAAIAEGRPPRVTLAQAAVTNMVVLGFYHATATGSPVALPLTDYRQPDLLGITAAEGCPQEIP